MSVPKYDELFNPTLQALHNLGGEGSIAEIEEVVAGILSLSENDVNEIHQKHRTKLNYRLAWARNYLKRFGLIERLDYAYWGLTEEGQRTKTVDKEKVKAIADESNVNEDVESEDTTERDSENRNVEQEDSSNSSDIERPFNPKKIDITTKPMTLESVFKRLKYGEIDLFTGFQRHRDLWDETKQSRLIESILIRFPLPAFYFDGNKDNKWQVVDGLQRLSSLENFVITKKLKLQNMEFLTQFNNCSFDGLPRDLQRRIEETDITAYIINPGTPDEVKFNVFKRINTGGLILEPQEIRHAINQGIPAQFVKELAELEEFKQATCYTIKTHRMLDRDFTTRYISFYIHRPEEYTPDLDTFMNKSMARIKDIPKEERMEIKTRFKRAMQTATTIFGNDAFRKRFELNGRRRPINKALFEVWSVLLSKLTEEECSLLINRKEQLISEFIELNNDENFYLAITSGTGDKSKVIRRFSDVNRIIKNIMNN